MENNWEEIVLTVSALLCKPLQQQPYFPGWELFLRHLLFSDRSPD